MVFYFLIGIVFIAEIIIAGAIVINLVKIDKMICLYDQILEEIKPKIKEILSIVRKISEQMIEFAPIIAEKIKSVFINMLKDQLKSLLAGLTFIAVKKEVEKRL